VAVIDSGVDYLHPALGGCFGTGCKVAFGYGEQLEHVFIERKITSKRFLDLVGDGYGLSNMTTVPDDDPLDNCSAESHGIFQSNLLSSVVLFLLTYFTQVRMFLE